MLITRPDHDITTNYLFYWSAPLIEYARKIGRVVIDLAKRRANAREFNSVVKKVKPNFIVFNGHGNESSITGYDDEVLIEEKQNSQILKDKIVYARACSSAKKLGKESIKKGCKGYIGYKDDFVFVTEDDKITRPLQDQTAALFLSPANQIVTSLLKGYSISAAHQKTKDKYKSIIQKFTTSAATKEERDLIPFLAWDSNNQVCLGNQKAKLI